MRVPFVNRSRMSRTSRRDGRKSGSGFRYDPNIHVLYVINQHGLYGIPIAH